MIILLLCVACTVLAALAFLVGCRVGAGRDSLIRDHLLDRYVVTIDHGETFTGLLARVDVRTLVLKDVKVTSSNDAPVDGELVLRRDSIVYMQRPR